MTESIGSLQRDVIEALARSIPNPLKVQALVFFPALEEPPQPPKPAREDPAAYWSWILVGDEADPLDATTRRRRLLNLVNALDDPHTEVFVDAGARLELLALVRRWLDEDDEDDESYGGTPPATPAKRSAEPGPASRSDSPGSAAPAAAPQAGPPARTPAKGRLIGFPLLLAAVALGLLGYIVMLAVGFME